MLFNKANFSTNNWAKLKLIPVTIYSRLSKKEQILALSNRCMDMKLMSL